MILAVLGYQDTAILAVLGYRDTVILAVLGYRDTVVHVAEFGMLAVDWLFDWAARSDSVSRPVIGRL